MDGLMILVMVDSDHVLASSEDINVLVRGYRSSSSNTGGRASKSYTYWCS